MVLDGPHSGKYYVSEAFCNDRAAELWWWYSPNNNGIYDIINNYGTKLLNHYACLWNQDGANVNGPIWSLVIVKDCGTTPPNNQNRYKN